ncbi:glycosyltransferase family 4 protein [Amphibacillus jilinensis]|uniref:glycosyltransferase family 4 protein n=1 Tax=Amphibacillus jilinensis TaxID=1216008 RepID=UPI0002F0BE0F|nr:glycosyltransferase family 4 protein [Amphibacillus jilinensis]
MRILQIACGFSYSNIYKNLFAELNRKNIDIEVYIPQHTEPEIKEVDPSEYPYQVYANKIIRGWDKYIYFSKILRMCKDVERNFDISKLDVIHAHSLFSDGGVAYELFKKHKIPYVVAVRDTDVNQYFKKARHLKPYALKILKNASTIVFLSKVYKESVIDKFVPTDLQAIFSEKSFVVPNGISSFWLQNIYKDRPKFNVNKEEITLLFVGQIIKRKNIESIIEAKKEIMDLTGKKIKILLVGEKKDNDYYRYLSKLGEFQHIRQCSQEELINFYRKSDVFVMPSLTETFGLVYAEAISQGLPVIYSKGQGFDGQFEDGIVGYSVSPMNFKELAKKIQEILKNYDVISARCINKCIRFNWEQITDDYISLYNSII